MKKSIVILLLCIAPTSYTANKIADAYCILGDAFHESGNHTQAIENYQHALKESPDHLQATACLGTLYFNKKQYKKAYTYLKQSRIHSPNNEEVGIMLAHCHTSLRNYAEATTLYSHILSINPQRIDLLFYRAQCYKKEHNYPNALQDVDHFLQLFPNDIPACTLKAHVLVELGKYEDAQETLAKLPESYTQAMIAAHLYTTIGKPQQAIELYSKAHTLKPHDRSYLLGLSYSYILVGDRHKGYHTMKEYIITPENQLCFLDTIDKIPGKRIFIGAEAILDNMVQYIRYAKYIHQLGGTTIVQAPTSLISVLHEAEYVDQVVSISETNIPPYDYHIPAILLPWLFDNYAADTVPYLTANSNLTTLWQSHIPHTNKKKIGVCWHLNETYCSPTQQRMLSTELLNDLFSLDQYSFIALYPKQSIPDLTSLKAPTHTITMCGAGFAENSNEVHSLLALIDTLDIVITVDTAIAHLAGALGKKTYLLLPFHAHWRWGSDGTCSPWYPTITIIRQVEPCNWQSSIKSLLEYL